LQLLPEAGAQRTLEAVSCNALFGPSVIRTLVLFHGFSALDSPPLQRLPALLGRHEQSFSVRIYGTNDVLDRLHGGLFKIRFATLDTHPSGDSIEDQVRPFTIDMKGGGGALHLTLTIHA